MFPVARFASILDQSMANNVTKYLCELQAEDQVLVFNSVRETSGGVIVGRFKQEVRPCVLIRLETRENQGQIFSNKPRLSDWVKREACVYVRQT